MNYFILSQELCATVQTFDIRGTVSSVNKMCMNSSFCTPYMYVGSGRGVCRGSTCTRCQKTSVSTCTSPARESYYIWFSRASVRIMQSQVNDNEQAWVFDSVYLMCDHVRSRETPRTIAPRWQRHSWIDSYFPVKTTNTEKWFTIERSRFNFKQVKIRYRNAEERKRCNALVQDRYNSNWHRSIGIGRWSMSWLLMCQKMGNTHL